jgi:pimeloyl-ACP methyl ester carboxylesterase
MGGASFGIVGSKLVLIPGVGHVIDIEAAERFNSEVKAFLRAQGQDARG